MKRKDILFLLITTTIFVFVWIVFSIYHNSITSTITDVLSLQISPISPNFDMTTFDKLKKREKVSPLWEFGKTSQTSVSTSSAILSPSLPATQAAQATPGGILTP